MREFPCAVSSVRALLIWEKKKYFFVENSTLVWFELFLDNYLFIRPENLKTSPGPSLEN